MKRVLLSLVALYSFASIWSQTLPDIQATYNGYVNQGAPTTTLYQSLYDFQIKNAPGFSRYGYLEFPLANIDTTANIILFKIYLSGSKMIDFPTTDVLNGAGLVLLVNTINYPFDNTFTWNNKIVPDATNETLIASIPLSDTLKDNWITVDVTSIAKRMKAAGETFIRFRLAAQGGTGQLLHFRQIEMSGNTVLAKGAYYPRIVQEIIDRSNMFGMQEQPTVCANIAAGSDKGVTPDLVANLCGALGVKSFRLLMNTPWVLEYNSAGELVFRQPNIQNFKDYAALLRQHGVKNIILSNTMYMYPYGASRSWWRAVPGPGTELYFKFMEQIEKSYEMIAGAFPDVTYFEVGNEMNAPNGINLCKEGFIGGATATQNAPYIFTTAEQAQITADICYYANRGIKSVNPNGKIVAPAPYLIDSLARNYMTSIYDQIKSGNLPTCRLESTTQKRELSSSTNPSDYFEYLNWHPYTSGGAYTLEWLRQNEALYQVAVDHGDAGRKIVMTEFGYFDSYLERRETLIGSACVPAIEVLADRLKTLEAVFLFRMFNWTTPPTGTATAEQTYGIFDSPSQSLGARPKPVAFSLFHYYNGNQANSDSLYMYMLQTQPEIKPTYNGYINQGAPTSTLYQSLYDFQIKNAIGYSRYGYFEFPLANIDDAATKISFKIYLSGSQMTDFPTTDILNGTSLTLGVSAINYTFDNTLTWNNKTIPDVYNETLIASILMSDTLKDTWLDVNVTSVVKAMRAAGKTYIRFRLSATGGTGQLLHFRQMKMSGSTILESGTYYPRLVQEIDSIDFRKIMRQSFMPYTSIVSDQIIVNEVNAQVFDIQGRLMLNSSAKNKVLNISSLRNGVYILKTENGSFKFVKHSN